MPEAATRFDVRELSEKTRAIDIKGDKSRSSLLHRRSPMPSYDDSANILRTVLKTMDTLEEPG